MNPKLELSKLVQRMVSTKKEEGTSHLKSQASQDHCTKKEEGTSHLKSQASQDHCKSHA
uniref:Uncharacterized protein n=1 Tax=Helianthus annuus TaxID=4232 RepID=A0A251STM3_HELAN